MRFFIFIPGSLKLLPKEADAMTAFGYIFKFTELRKLYTANAMLSEGMMELGGLQKQGFVLTYKGEVLCSGTREEVGYIVKRITAYGNDVVKVLDNFIETAGKVELGLSLFSQEAIAFRKGLGIAARFHKGNIAVFEFINKEGQIERKAFTTLEKPEEWKVLGFENKPHAEEIAFDWLEKQGIKDVKAIYSELEPCILTKHDCKAKIAIMFPNARVSHSYFYNNDPIVMKKAIFDRGIDLLNFLK